MKFNKYCLLIILGFIILNTTGCKQNDAREPVTENITTEENGISSIETANEAIENEEISKKIARLQKGVIPELDSYIDIINQYIEAMNHDFYKDILFGESNEWDLIGSDINLELLSSLGWYDDFKVYYALEDIEENGNPVLFIGGSAGDDIPKIYDMYISTETQAVNPFAESGYEFGHRTNLYYYSSGIISVEWTNSGRNNGMEFYKLLSDEYRLELVEGISINDESYYHDISDNKTITEEEFCTILHRYRDAGKAELQWFEIDDSIYDRPAADNSDLEAELTEKTITEEPTENELTAIIGQWYITEYLGESVEFHGIEKTEEDKKEEEEIKAAIKETYLKRTLEIDYEKVEYFYAPTELDYLYSTWSDLFSIYRQPADVWNDMEMAPPYFCISIKHEEFNESFDVIVDNHGNTILWVRGLFFLLERSNVNEYFFKDGITSMEYEGFVLPLSNEEIRQNVTLNIDYLKTFANANLYALKLEPLNVSDSSDQFSMGRDKLGYFYVTEDKIYRMHLDYDKDFTDENNQEIIDTIEQNEKEFLSKCDIVCSSEATSNLPDEDGWYRYVELDGERRIFRYYNSYEGGTSFYESIIWEPGQGITYYRSGSGAMVMHVEFGKDLSGE